MADTPQLDPDFKARWIAALRSGEFKQGRGFLANAGRLCCLGVARKIEGFTNPRGKTFPSQIELDRWGLFGMKGANVGRDLAEMNDAGKSFADIADYIEQNL